MKKLAFVTAAGFALALVLVSAASLGAAVQGDRMVGGGWVDDPDLAPDPTIKVRQGMELWCGGVDDPNLRPSSLEITWGSGNYFHLSELRDVACFGNDPQLRDDGGTISGSGEGRCNGQHAEISFTFIDNPNIRLGDAASIAIEGDNQAVCGLNLTTTPLLGGNFTFIDNPDI